MLIVIWCCCIARFIRAMWIQFHSCVMPHPPTAHRGFLKGVLLVRICKNTVLITTFVVPIAPTFYTRLFVNHACGMQCFK